MVKLNYEWIAIYNDGVRFFQFDQKTRKENRYDDIEQKRLVMMIIKNFSTGDEVAIDLIHGRFVINGKVLRFQNLDSLKDPYRLIYFRRVTHEISKNNDNISVVHNLGFQITPEENKDSYVNRKQIMCIEDNNGILELRNK